MAKHSHLSTSRRLRVLQVLPSVVPGGGAEQSLVMVAPLLRMHQLAGASSQDTGGVPILLSSRFWKILHDCGRGTGCRLRVSLGGCEVGLLVGEHVEQGTCFPVREADHRRVVALPLSAFLRVVDGVFSVSSDRAERGEKQCVL